MTAQESNDLMQRMKLAKSAHIPLNTMEKIIIVIPGPPTPKQSVRFGGGRTFQPPELVYAKKKIKADIAIQLPKGFIPWKGPVRINRIAFVYEYLKSHTKKERELSQQREQVLWKVSRPDFDNLCKLPFDCMSELIYIDDSQICEVGHMKKYYGLESFTMIELQPLQL